MWLSEWLNEYGTFHQHCHGVSQSEPSELSYHVAGYTILKPTKPQYDQLTVY